MQLMVMSFLEMATLDRKVLKWRSAQHFFLFCLSKLMHTSGRFSYNLTIGGTSWYISGLEPSQYWCQEAIATQFHWLWAWDAASTSQNHWPLDRFGGSCSISISLLGYPRFRWVNPWIYGFGWGWWWMFLYFFGVINQLRTLIWGHFVAEWLSYPSRIASSKRRQ